jgi:hypothetical protein
MGQSGSSACSTFAEEKASYVGVNFLRSATDRRSPLGNRAHASISLTVMNDNGCIRVRATKRSELDHKGFTPLRKLSGSSGSLLRDMLYLRAGSNTVFLFQPQCTDFTAPSLRQGPANHYNEHSSPHVPPLPILFSPAYIKPLN